MLFEVKNGTLSLGGNEILSHFDFRMVDGEKIGIVGRNGSGKTTFLKYMMGEIELDYNDDNTKGELNKSRDFKCGYLKQQLAGDKIDAHRASSTNSPMRVNDSQDISNKDIPMTAYNYLLSAFDNLIAIEQKIEKISMELGENYDEKKAIDLNRLIDTYTYNGGDTYIIDLKTGFKKFGFKENELEKPMTEFSGGQATKISLLRLLLERPEVLVLDEPTNHLDVIAIEWMEKYLQKSKKNVVVVSHDRMFLDNICNVIYDVENKLMTRYEGNYTEYVEQKEINYQLKLAEYNNNLKEIERLTALADRFRYKATKAKMVQSKDKMIEKLKKKTEKPKEANTKTFNVNLKTNKKGGKEVFSCRDLVVGYCRPQGDQYDKSGDQYDKSSNQYDKSSNQYDKLSNQYDKSGDQYDKSSEKTPIAIIENFTIYRGDRLAIVGANGTGKSTFIKTIVDNIKTIEGEFSYGHEIEFEYFDQRIAENSSTKTLFDDFADEFPQYNNTDVRNRLGRFLFGEEDILKRVCDLSGGEKVRLCLSKIFERKPNLLILDEPTNHLDILGKESLEKIIEGFEGTVILVSHDRYFVKKVSNKILFFEKNSDVATSKFFEFGYEDYEKYVK